MLNDVLSVRSEEPGAIGHVPDNHTALSQKTQNLRRLGKAS